MKKKLLLLLLVATMCFNLCGCIVEESEEDIDATRSAQLEEKYDFYSKSIDAIKEEMELTTQQANSVFEVFIEIGLNKKIGTILVEDEYYSVWLNNQYVDVYLSDGEISKIMAEGIELYPNSPDSIITWDDSKTTGYVTFDMEASDYKETIILDFSNYLVNYLTLLNTDNLPEECTQIQFYANVMKDNEKMFRMSCSFSIDFIKNTEKFSVYDVEKNMLDRYLPPELQ